MLQGVGQWPVDTAEEAAVRRRPGRKKEKKETGWKGGQSALTATGVADWDLSRLDRWTDTTGRVWLWMPV